MEPARLGKSFFDNFKRFAPKNFWRFWPKGGDGLCYGSTLKPGHEPKNKALVGFWSSFCHDLFSVGQYW
jgi:hypothetical protein